MIGALRGPVLDVLGPTELLIDVHGVGYRVTVSPGLAATSRPGPDALFLHVHTHVREDAIVLYGFLHADERRSFEALLLAHGVGPSLAMAILSALSPAVLSTAVLEEDVDTLCLVPGVGKKTAARLLLELKTRLDLPNLDRPTGGGDGASARNEARAALAELGYGPDEIASAMEDADPEATVEELVRAALRDLARQR